MRTYLWFNFADDGVTPYANFVQTKDRGMGYGTVIKAVSVRLWLGIIPN